MMGRMTLDKGNIASAFKIDELRLGNALTGVRGPAYCRCFRHCSTKSEGLLLGKTTRKKQISSGWNPSKEIGDEIAKNATELVKLEKEEKTKITSEGLHEGFSSSVWQSQVPLTIVCREIKHQTL
jgi:hypothetical protein